MNKERNLEFVASSALVASSCNSYWINAKFLLILTLTIFPYGSKCLSKSRVLVLSASKLMTKRVLEGRRLDDLLEPLDLVGAPRSFYTKPLKKISIHSLSLL